MTETKLQGVDINYGEIAIVETADTNSSGITRVIIKMPIMTAGINKKSLNWTPDVLNKIAKMFRGIPFRYDLNGGNEGSHTKERLSSPFYDVGWTYSNDQGAYYDPLTKQVWIQGEVTHPEVIQKLKRMTSDGKREINFGSMGAMIDPHDTMCNVCGKSPFGTCEHQRGEYYNGKVCAMTPCDIKKALHIALTNDPADPTAEIKEAIFQDMTNMVDSFDRNMDGASKGPVSPNLESRNEDELKEIIALVTNYLKKKRETTITQEDTEMETKKKKVDGKVESEMAAKTSMGNDSLKKDVEASSLKNENSEPITEDDKIITSEESGKVEEKIDKLGDKIEKLEDSNKDMVDKDDEVHEQLNDKVETSETMPGDQGTEADYKGDSETKNPTSDEKESVRDTFDKENSTEEESDEDEKRKKQVESNIPMLQEDSGSEFKIKGETNKKSKTVFQDNSKPVLETADSNVNYAEKYKKKLLLETADMCVKLGKYKSVDEANSMLGQKSIEQLELFQEALDGIKINNNQVKQPKVVLQDNSSENIFQEDIPEYGTIVETDYASEFQDMSGPERRDKFGEYGSWDLCFNPQNINKYRR